MKEIFKSKVMVGFMVFIIGVCTFNAISINNEIEMQKSNEQEALVLNQN